MADKGQKAEGPQTMRLESARDPALERFKTLPLLIRALVLTMAGAGVVIAVCYIFGFIPLLDLTYYFLLMAMYLPAVFLFIPAFKGERGVTWLSYLPAVLTLGVTLFLASKGSIMVFQTWVPANEWQLTVAVALFVLVLEAARRTGGYVFLALVVFFALYPVFAEYMPGIFWGPPTSLARTIAFNMYSADALLGVVTRVVGETLIGYLFLAALLVGTGAADFFLKLAMALMGTSRGGPAKVAVVASGGFGSLSGSIFGNVVSTGSVTIPSMMRSGFPGYYAAALEACASTGGMLMPPVMGAIAFIMADFTGTEYVVIVAAAAIPSLLYYFGLYCHVDGYAVKAGLKGMRRADLPSVKQTLKDGWPFIAVLLFLIWGLVMMRWERLTPFYAAALLIILTLLKKSMRIPLARVPSLLFESGKLLSQTMGLLLPTSFILGGMMGTGVAPVVTSELVRLGGGNIVLVLGIGILVCMIFGMMGMMVAAYLMLALTLAPALEQLAGLNTIAVHLFIAYYSTLAAITPPIALAAFLASSISGSAPIQTSMHAARLGIVLYFIPIFFLFEPALIFQGPLYETVIWTGANILAIVLIAAGSEGYLIWYGRLRGWTRVALFVGGLLIGFPNWKTTFTGLSIFAIVVLLRGLGRHPLPFGERLGEAAVGVSGGK